MVPLIVFKLAQGTAGAGSYPLRTGTGSLASSCTRPHRPSSRVKRPVFACRRQRHRSFQATVRWKTDRRVSRRVSGLEPGNFDASIGSVGAQHGPARANNTLALERKKGGCHAKNTLYYDSTGRNGGGEWSVSGAAPARLVSDTAGRNNPFAASQLPRRSQLESATGGLDYRRLCSFPAGLLGDAPRGYSAKLQPAG